MTVQYYLIPLIAVMMLPAYAQVDEIDVGFEWFSKSCTESTIATAEGSVPRLNCSWLGQVPEGATIIKDTEGNIEIVIEQDADTETKISDDATVTTPEPVIKSEQQIKLEGIISAQEKIEGYGSGELSVDKLCFGGTERENKIFQQFETIDVKTPNDNTPLRTNIQFKYEHLMSEICKAEYTMSYKVHNRLRTAPGEGEAYIFVPRDNFEETSDYSPPWQNTTGLDNPQYAYDEAKMTDFNFEKSINTAEGFQCSVQGKAQGHCIKEIGETIVEPTISKEAKKILDAYWILRETGEAELPFKEPDAEFEPTTALDQYIDAYGISEEELKQWYESRK